MIGCSEETICKRKRDPEFMRQYTEARTAQLTKTRDLLQTVSTCAVGTLVEIMQNKDVSPQTRINAADAILRHSTKYTEIVDILERIKALEASNAD